MNPIQEQINRSLRKHEQEELVSKHRLAIKECRKARDKAEELARQFKAQQQEVAILEQGHTNANEAIRNLTSKRDKEELPTDAELKFYESELARLNIIVQDRLQALLQGRTVLETLRRAFLQADGLYIASQRAVRTLKNILDGEYPKGGISGVR